MIIRKLCIIFTVLLCLVSLHANKALSQTTPGVVVEHAADQTIPYTWFSYVPNSISKGEKNYILINTGPGIRSIDYNDMIEDARGNAEGVYKSWAETYKYIVLKPVIPECQNSYANALDRKCFLSETNPFCQRPDEKVNLIIDKLITDLQQAGYNISNKVFFEGFSAGGGFALRYTILCPERVQAMTAGGVVDPTLPIKSYNGTLCDWPVGVNDFVSLVGYEFNESAYKDVPQFIYIGELDTNSTIYIYNELLTDQQINFVNETFGGSDGNDPLRLENMCNYMQELGCNVTFKLNLGIGHTFAPETEDDIFTFFAQYREDSSVNNGSSGGGGGACFIATAAYGSPIEPHVKLLREFRDRILLTNNIGRSFVGLYYTYSPPIADFIASHDAMRLVVRWSLLPVVGVSWMSLNIGPLPALILMFVVGFGLIGLAGFKRKLRKR